MLDNRREASGAKVEDVKFKRVSSPTKQHFELPDAECKRMTQSELSMVIKILNAITLIAHADNALRRQMEIIPNGVERFKEMYDSAESFMLDIIGTISDNQRMRIHRTTQDYEIQARPKLMPESTNVVIDQTVLRNLFNEASHKCVDCVEDKQSCRQCELFKIMEAYAPLNVQYNGFSCPYHNIDWRKD